MERNAPVNATYARFSEQDNRVWTLLRRFSVVLLWPLYLIVAPLAVQRLGAWALLLLVPVGTYLVMWVGLLRHEVWHRNFDRVDPKRAFRLLSYLILTDPNPYYLFHGQHHTHVHTRKDPVIFCEGYEDLRTRRRVFVLELLLGNAVWEFMTLGRLVRTGKVSRKEVLGALPYRLAPLLATAAATYAVGGPRALALHPLTALLTLWAGSQAARHTQWIEHLGVLAEGSMEERSLKTHNLTRGTPFGWLFNVLTLNETWNHTYHHVEPAQPLSSIDEVAPAADHRVIDGRQYAAILWTYWKSLQSAAAEGRAVAVHVDEV
jgi:fatty acid desaturase